MTLDLVGAVIALTGFAAGAMVTTFRAGMRYQSLESRMASLSHRFEAIEALFTLRIRREIIVEREEM